MSLKKGRHYGDYIKKIIFVFSIIRKFYWLEVTTIFFLVFVLIYRII